MKKIVLIAAATMLPACGGGGAAGPSAPQAPTGTGNAPTAPPTNPAQPQPQPQPPAPSPPPAPPAAPSSATIQTPERSFSPSNVKIAVNGTVTWQAVDDDHRIRFTSAAPPGGSPGDLEEGESVSRTFTAPGTYDYECERHRDKGMRGTIVVEAASGQQPPPPSTPAPPAPAPPAGSAVTVTTPNETFSPSNVTIPTGGSVTWQFSQTRHNVTFQGTLPAGGNVPDQEAGTSASRTFTVPGTYDYICTRHAGMSGRVVVQ